MQNSVHALCLLTLVMMSATIFLSRPCSMLIGSGSSIDAMEVGEELVERLHGLLVCLGRVGVGHNLDLFGL
jgi:hypothetical protein